MNILLIGATSAIAQETARCFASEKASFFLVARSEQKLTIVANDLRARGAARVETFVLNADDLLRHALMVEAAYRAYPSFDRVLIAHGVLTPQAEMSENPTLTAACMLTNATSVMTMIACLLPRLKQIKGGQLAVISSVAGDLGRASLYTYGAAKASLNVFLQGVRGELMPFNVSVLTIKPGYVDTPMTAHLKRSPLTASASFVGARIFKAMKSGRTGEMYVPWFWWAIMTILRCLPEKLFLRLPI